jgi:hypothetical protein
MKNKPKKFLIWINYPHKQKLQGITEKSYWASDSIIELLFSKLKKIPNYRRVPDLMVKKRFFDYILKDDWDFYYRLPDDMLIKAGDKSNFTLFISRIVNSKTI